MFFKASDAFKTWKKTTSKERASILRKIGDLVLENKVGNYLDREGNCDMAMMAMMVMMMVIRMELIKIMSVMILVSGCDDDEMACQYGNFERKKH